MESLKFTLFAFPSAAKAFPLDPNGQTIIKFQNKTYKVQSYVLNFSTVLKELTNDNKKKDLSKLLTHAKSEVAFDCVMQLLFGIKDVVVPREELVQVYYILEELKVNADDFRTSFVQKYLSELTGNNLFELFEMAVTLNLSGLKQTCLEYLILSKFENYSLKNNSINNLSEISFIQLLKLALSSTHSEFNNNDSGDSLKQYKDLLSSFFQNKIKRYLEELFGTSTENIKSSSQLPVGKVEPGKVIKIIERPDSKDLYIHPVNNLFAKSGNNIIISDPTSGFPIQNIQKIHFSKQTANNHNLYVPINESPKQQGVMTLDPQKKYNNPSFMIIEQTEKQRTISLDTEEKNYIEEKVPASFTEKLFNAYLEKVNEEIKASGKIIMQMSLFEPPFKNEDFNRIYCIYHDSKTFKLLIEVNKKAEEVILYNPNGTAFRQKINDCRDEVVKLVCGGNSNLKYQEIKDTLMSGSGCLETIAWMIENNVLFDKTETINPVFHQKSWEKKIREKIQSVFGLK